MTAEQIQALLKERFGEKITGAKLDAIDPWIEVAADAIADVARYVKTDSRLLMDHLNNLTGVDYFEPNAAKQKSFGHEPHVEVVYHLTSYSHKHKITLKVILPRWKGDVAGQIPDVPSVSGVWGIANWHERECYDLVGVNFVGHPNQTRILCADDWVGYPLRKDYDFPLEYHGMRGK